MNRCNLLEPIGLYLRFLFGKWLYTDNKCMKYSKPHRGETWKSKRASWSSGLKYRVLQCSDLLRKIVTFWSMVVLSLFDLREHQKRNEEIYEELPSVPWMIKNSDWCYLLPLVLNWYSHLIWWTQVHDSGEVWIYWGWTDLWHMLRDVLYMIVYVRPYFPWLNMYPPLALWWPKGLHWKSPEESAAQ